MVDVKIIDAKPYHCGQLARRLRHEHQNSLSLIDVDIHKELRNMFDNSAFRRAGFINGELSALWGVSGSLLDDVGYVWVALTETARAFPVLVTREAKKQLAEMMKTRRELATTVLPSDDAATRFAIFLGFHSAHNGRGSPAYSKFSRTDLKRYIEETPDFRISVGKGFAVALGYHVEN